MFAILRCQDLLCIGRRYRRDLVAVQDAGFQERNAAVVTYVAIVQQIPWQAQAAVQHFGAEVALECQVVNRQHELQVAVSGIVVMCFPHHAGNHGCLPVVAVDDVGPVVELVEHLYDCLLEIRKPFPVIIVAIEGIPFEISLMLDEEEADGAFHFGKYLDRHFMEVDGNRIFAAEMKIVEILFCDFFIQRQNDLDFMTLIRQSQRQRADYISQAARLDERQPFTGRK